MEIMQWGFFADTSRDMADVISTIQQATTTYRPNKIIYDITRKKIPLPFESKMSRPFYHMDRPHMFAETFYASESYAIGSVQMPIVDNPNQQVVWSLVVKGTETPLAFSGGHPMRSSTSGHSPYTQVLQSKGSLALITAPTLILEELDTVIARTYTATDRENLWHLPDHEQREQFEVRNRQKYGKTPLKILSYLENESPQVYEDFYNGNQGSASSWLYYPKSLTPEWHEGKWFFKANQTFVAVVPLTDTSYTIAPKETIREGITGKAAKFFNDYSILVFPGQKSGYVIETGEYSTYKTMENFKNEMSKKKRIDKSKFKEKLILDYVTLEKDAMQMKYAPYSLRCKGWINGVALNWDNFTNNAVYDGRYIKVKNGKMWVNNGKEGYTVEFKKGRPVWKNYKVKL